MDTRKADIILLQEHWQFDTYLPMLSEIHPDLIGVGKAVDSEDPISPAQMPRGYGGVAILWRKEIDHHIRHLPDGNARIQAIEITTTQDKIIIVSVYMPSKGKGEQVEEFLECIGHLHEILDKYQGTHKVVIGGDFNEEMNNTMTTKRQKALSALINEHNLVITKTSQKTFTHPNGHDATEIDYFIQTNQNQIARNAKILDRIDANVSDHHPIEIILQSAVQNATSRKNIGSSRNKKPRWKNIDTDKYKTLIAEGTESINIIKDSKYSIDKAVDDVNKLLNHVTKKCDNTNTKVKNRKNHKTVWNEKIAKQIKAKRYTHWAWKKSGRPSNPSNPLMIARKVAKQDLRKEIRIAVAEQRLLHREEIMNARINDTNKMYHLINKHRGKMGCFITELNVADNLYNGEEILEGWTEHFKTLAEPKLSANYNEDYLNLVQKDIDIIIDICQQEQGQIPQFNHEEIKIAIAKLNKNKSADIHGLTAEHIINAGDTIIATITEILNAIMKTGYIPSSMKAGLVTPVFKNKGNKFEAKNYRGITITPILTKILEFLLSRIIRPVILRSQNSLQRGFTAGASPMMCALILEEYTRNADELGHNIYTAYLDAKSAFDVVNQDSLMRKLYNMGIDGKVWTIIKNLHHGTTSKIKWNGELSPIFRIHQGVRQGGLISADMYKIYINDLLDRLQHSGQGATIGPIYCGAPTCADDVTLLAKSDQQLQTMLDIAVDYSNRERYALQPSKSAIQTRGPTKRTTPTHMEYKIGHEMIEKQDRVTHLGIIRDTNSTSSSTIENNISKATRRIYSLMKPGLHGENGLDPVTCIHLMKIYVMPILLYGLEICLLQHKHIKKLEAFQRKILKQILSIPTTTADPAVYILTGMIPIEAEIHKRSLSLFGAISRLSESSTEKKLAYRQLLVKGHNSKSWFKYIQKLTWRYGLPDPMVLLEQPIPSRKWKHQVNKSINCLWKEDIITKAQGYSTLKHLGVGNYEPGRPHSILQTIPGNSRDVTRLLPKLKIATGTYILQSNRKAFNQNRISGICQLCSKEDETIEHFVLHCPTLQIARDQPLKRVKESIQQFYNNITEESTKDDLIIQAIIDSSILTELNQQSDEVKQLNFNARRLCNRIHVERYRLLQLNMHTKIKK